MKTDRAAIILACIAVVIGIGSTYGPVKDMARSSHRKVDILPGDTVIIAATPVPGNEKYVGRTIDELFRLGANVIYSGSNSGVHVSGHGSQEELKLMLNLMKPKYFIPIHGEYRMQRKHAKSYGKQGEIERLFEEEPVQVATKVKETKLAVSMPKLLFGFKEKSEGLVGEAAVRRDLTTKLMLDLLLGSSTSLYQKLYDEELISDSFGHEFNSSPQYAFSAIGGDTKDPDLLLKRIKEEINLVLETGFAVKDFQRARKKKIGGYLRMRRGFSGDMVRQVLNILREEEDSEGEEEEIYFLD